MSHDVAKSPTVPVDTCITVPSTLNYGDTKVCSEYTSTGTYQADIIDDTAYATIWRCIIIYARAAPVQYFIPSLYYTGLH